MNDLITRSALEWLSENTTIPVDLNDPDATIPLPARAQLFVQKYAQLMNRSPGVISQSIEGLSQSFDASGDVTANVWALARALLMGDLKSQVKVTPAKRRW